LGYIARSVKTLWLKKAIHSQDHRRLCALLKRLREEKAITQATLAARMDSPQSFISKIEAGERRLDVLELRRLCSALEIPFRKFALLLEEELT
jgi:transcriptional regulator with XRE-family HTH domain